MSPPLASLLTVLLILGLFKLDSRTQAKPSAAVWIPFIWLLILGSRSVWAWMNLGSPIEQSPEALAEGSPTDRVVYFVLMVTAGVVLQRRHVSVRHLLRQNVALTLFFLYTGVSVLWSDFPLVAAKRWFKGLGDPMMVLILLTEQHPAAAVAFVFKRLAFVLMPLSILFIKYYPEIGRVHGEWGHLYYTGVTTNKNLLGYLLLVFGLLFVCTLVGRSRQVRRKAELLTAILMLSMIGWLFHMANTKTPLLCLVLATFVVVGLRVSSVRRQFDPLFVFALTLCVAIEASFNFAESVVGSAGRDMTLTGRTDLWERVIGMAVDPLIGAGYESFWLGDRLKELWAAYYFRPTQAHNGYIEVYLNLGWFGICFMGGVLVAGYLRMRKRLEASTDPVDKRARSFDFAEYGMAYFIAFLFYNITEGIFQALNFLFIVFLIFAIRYSRSEELRDLAGIRGRPSFPLERRLIGGLRPGLRPGIFLAIPDTSPQDQIRQSRARPETSDDEVRKSHSLAAALAHQCKRDHSQRRHVWTSRCGSRDQFRGRW